MDVAFGSVLVNVTSHETEVPVLTVNDVLFVVSVLSAADVALFSGFRVGVSRRGGRVRLRDVLRGGHADLGAVPVRGRPLGPSGPGCTRRR